MIAAPMNGEPFLAYVEQFLAPTLSPGDIVVTDNLPAHEVKGIAEAIDAREAAERTADATWQRIGSPLAAFSPDDCANSLTTQAM